MTDACLQHIKQLRYLRILNLACTFISDEAALAIRTLNLYELNVSRCHRITDTFFHYLATETSCRLSELRAGHCNITDIGVNHISSFSTLSVLHLPCTEITKCCLVFVNMMPNIVALSIYGTKITDEDIDAALHMNHKVKITI